MKKQKVVHGDGKKKNKKKMVVHVGDTAPYLADELITNILKRLPMKSLIRFQCVSKHWKNLIKSPSFIDDHLLHHPRSQNPNLLFEQRRDHPMNLFVVDCQMRGLDIHKPPFMSISNCPSFIGTCNGLICVRSLTFSSGNSLFLWNPATREVRRVPGVIHDDDDGCFYFGFGFSPIVNDYKIVKIFKSHDVIKGVEVYSMNADCWREIEFGNIKDVQIFYPNSFANGSIFWQLLKKGVESKGIVSFDTTMEVFTLMQSPVLDHNSNAFLGIVHGKKLVLLCLTTNQTELDFWVMEEEGVDASGYKKWSSWTKVDNSSPYLSNLSTNISAIWQHGRALSFVESLVSVVGPHP